MDRKNLHRKRLAPICALMTVGVLSAVTAHAAPIAQWRFDDAAGTTSDETANTGSTTPGTWDDPLGGSATTGTGDLRIRRASGEDSHTLFSLSANDAAITTGVAYYHVAVSGFNFVGTTVERLRFEFAHLSTGGGTAAGMLLERNTVGGEIVIQVAGRALGTGSGTEDFVTIMAGSTLTTPLDLVLELDKDQNTYGVWYRFGQHPYRLAIGGTVDPGRNGNVLVFTAEEHLASSANEFFDIDSITVSRTNPIPEPVAGSLLLVSGALLLSGRERRGQG